MLSQTRMLLSTPLALIAARAVSARLRQGDACHPPEPSSRAGYRKSLEGWSRAEHQTRRDHGLRFSTTS